MPSPAQALTTRTVWLAEIDEDDRQRWSGLAARALEPNPFLDPAFLYSAHRWLPTTQGIRLVLVEDGERMLALLPLSLERRFQRLPLPYATTAGPFLSSRAPLCAPLVDRERAPEALAALLGHLSSRRSGLPGLVELTLFPGEGPLLEALTAAARERGVPVLERYRFERACLRPDGEDWRSQLSSSRRKALGRRRRGIERELGAPVVITDRGADPQGFEEFMDLEAAGWKGRPENGGGAIRVTPNAVDWFTDVAAGFRDRGNLRILTMTAGDEVLYMSLSFAAGGRLFSLMDTYNETYAHLSPGTVGRAEELDHVQDVLGAEMFDPCMHPKRVESSALYPHRRPLVGLLLAPRGAVNRTLVRAIPGLTTARDAVRTQLRRRRGSAQPDAA